MGANVIRTGKDHVKATVPLGSLPVLATDVAPLDYARLPIKPHLNNAVISEGVGLTNADDWHTRGITGAGIKVAVIDGGFIGLAALKAADEIPASAIEVDYAGSGMETMSPHGCAVAEIVYDMAPGAQLYLINVYDESDVQAAGSYCTANGIHVVNHSMGWYGFNFFDGVAYGTVVPSMVTTVNDATANGTLWVNSAGNDRQRHCSLPWVDSDVDGDMEWAPGPVDINQIGYLSAGTVVVLWLTWDPWPATDQDFDLYLVRWDGVSWVEEAHSWNWQTGTEPPTESIGVYVSTTAYYGVVVLKYSATTSPQFILRSWFQNLEYYSYNNTTTPAPGSIGCPADAASALAAGAIDEDNYATGPIEDYSSIGPTNGAYTGQPVHTKPDLCGPDDTASVTYAGGFGGTSASSPHVVGAAALAWSAFPNVATTNETIRGYLELGDENIDLGSPGDDNEYGHGALVLTDDFHAMMLTIKNPDYGTVTVDQSLPEYPHDVVVRLGADPCADRSYKTWKIWDDPNQFPDPNYVVKDGNTVLFLTMDSDHLVEAVFSCQSGVEPLLPVILMLMGGAAFLRRRR
jgi:subtilisin family serine protease